MKCAQRSGGYTIIETLIVLAVSGMLFGSVVFAMSQQNRRTQFTQSVQTFEQELGDIINDVETGYYPSNGTVSCNGGAAGAQGTNVGCIFIGKAIQSPLSTESFDAFTLYGTRQTGAPEAQNLTEANPKAITTDDGGSVDQIALSAGVEVYRIIRLIDNAEVPDGFAIVSGFAQNTGEGLARGYSTRASLATLSDTINEDGFLTTDNLNEAREGILLCLQESGGGRKATITIGQGSQKLALTTTIYSDNNGDSRCD